MVKPRHKAAPILKSECRNLQVRAKLQSNKGNASSLAYTNEETCR